MLQDLNTDSMEKQAPHTIYVRERNIFFSIDYIFVVNLGIYIYIYRVLLISHLFSNFFSF